MDANADVLIVGAGPTGLMMASQLLRFGISFRIIDRQIDRVKESRAFGIQAKSMEIFQNLGIESEFLANELAVTEFSFHVNGEFKFGLNFSNLNLKDTPFPSLFIIPQSKTEEILLTYLAKHHQHIERQTDLVTFSQEKERITAEIKNNITGKMEKIQCRYIIGCDGSHSKVREVLDIPFVGASYRQEFVLADVFLEGEFTKYHFNAFMGKNGNFLSIPLDNEMTRLIFANTGNAEHKLSTSPTIQEIENFAKNIVKIDVKIRKLIWASRFYLHHRAVKQYQKGHAFIAGDAAHIHTPVGAQGMNTGIQDVTNLAWKLALVLKYQSPKELLDTYQVERERIGAILVKTTDKIFDFLFTKNSFKSFLRLYIMPQAMSFLTKIPQFKQCLFYFISQLRIRYHKNAFVIEINQGADRNFLKGPEAGCRAPDAPVDKTSLFEIFRQKPINILLFQSEKSISPSKISILKKINPDIIGIHEFQKSFDRQIIFDRYGITNSGAYLIRPDGYIGFRSFGIKIESLLKYLARLGLGEGQALGPH